MIYCLTSRLHYMYIFNTKCITNCHNQVSPYCSTQNATWLVNMKLSWSGYPVSWNWLATMTLSTMKINQLMEIQGVGIDSVLKLWCEGPYITQNYTRDHGLKEVQIVRMLQHKGLESLDSLCLISQLMINHGATGIFCNRYSAMKSVVSCVASH